MARILVITHEYAPKNNPRAFRWQTLTREFMAAGHHVDIITAAMPGLPLKEDEGQISIYRVSGGLLDKFRQSSLEQGQVSGPSAETATLATTLKHRFKQILKSVWQFIRWPDYACLWIFPAAQKARQLMREHSYDALVSVSLPYSSHLVAKSLRKKFPGVPWLVDVGDPFSFMHATQTNNYRLYGWLNRKSERKVFALADAVSVTTQATKDEYVKLYGEDMAGKIHVMPPLLSTPVSQENRQEDNHKPLQMMFVGSLYKGIRSPDYLLEVFALAVSEKEAPQMELHFVGDIRDTGSCFEAYRPLLDRSVFLHGLKTKQEVEAMIAQADILVNIGNTTHYQLPSKVVEYAASRKTVINVVSTQQDSSAVFFEGYPAAANLYRVEGVENSADKMKQLIRERPQVSLERATDFLTPYRADFVAKQYLQAVGQ